MFRPKEAAAKLVLLGVSTAVCVGIAEMAVRAVAPQPMVQRYLAPDAEVGFVIRPNQSLLEAGRTGVHPPYRIRTNDAGFRMDERVRRGGDAQRILVFGDSFTFGWAVEYEDSFFARVKQRVEERLPQVQLLNAGTGGYSTGHVTKYLRRLAPRLDPCAAIYFMSATDPFDNAESHENYNVTSWARRPDGSIELEDRLAYTPLKRLVLVHSPYPWLKQNVHLFVWSMRALRELLGSRGEATRVGPTMGPPFGTLDLPAEQQQLLVDVSVAHLERLADEARQSGVALQVVWIPAWTELFAPDAPINDMLETLRRRARAGALSDLVDPTARLAAAMDGRVPTEVYYRDGEPVGHFNPLGNALYADAVAGDVIAFAERAVAPCTGRRR